MVAWLVTYCKRTLKVNSTRTIILPHCKFMLSGYLDFSIFGESKIFKTHGVIVDITAYSKLLFLLLL